MQHNKKIIFWGVLAICIILILIWAPWLSKSKAEIKAKAVFLDSQQNLIDGCGFNCIGCGVKESQRRLRGYLVTIEYACGGLLYDLPESHETKTYLISLFGGTK